MKKTQTHLAYGFITALVMLVISVGLQVAKLSTNPVMKWVGILVFLIGIILNALAYSKANNADVTFGEVFGSCFKATLIIVVVTTIWTWVALEIFPEIKAQAIEQASAQMEKKGALSSEQIDKAIDITKRYFGLIAVGSALIGSLVFGTIFSLIGGGVAKKNPRPTGQF